MRRVIRSFLSTLKKLSVTGLPWQFPRRLMFGTIRCAFRKDCQSLLVNWLPRSEWIITLAGGLRFRAVATRYQRGGRALAAWVLGRSQLS